MPQKSFRLNSSNLARILSCYGLAWDNRSLFLFALRGATPLQDKVQWSESGEIEVSPVDYKHMRCTFGLWKPAVNQMLLAPGSTVPHADQVAWAAARPGKLKGRGTNQLEPGFYADLRRGEHLQGKPKGHAALRQTAFRFYRRSAHPIPYGAKDPLYFGNPYDNLHCAWNDDPLTPGFSSAGCMVIAGMPHCPRLPDSGPNSGPWKAFHQALYAGSQDRFPLALISAREVAALLSNGRDLSHETLEPRLIYGSHSPEAMRLQKKLVAQGLLPSSPRSSDGILGSRTYRAWNALGLKGYGDILGC